MIFRFQLSIVRIRPSRFTNCCRAEIFVPFDKAGCVSAQPSFAIQAFQRSQRVFLDLSKPVFDIGNLGPILKRSLKSTKSNYSCAKSHVCRVVAEFLDHISQIIKYESQKYLLHFCTFWIFARVGVIIWSSSSCTFWIFARVEVIIWSSQLQALFSCFSD